MVRRTSHTYKLEALVRCWQDIPGLKTTKDAPIVGIMFSRDIDDMKQCVGIGPTWIYIYAIFQSDSFGFSYAGIAPPEGEFLGESNNYNPSKALKLAQLILSQHLIYLTKFRLLGLGTGRTFLLLLLRNKLECQTYHHLLLLSHQIHPVFYKVYQSRS